MGTRSLADFYVQALTVPDPVLYSGDCWVEEGRAANPSATARYIGSGEAASYRRLPPSEPRGPYMARTPARPVRAVKEWPAMIAGHSASGQAARPARCAATPFSSQVRLAGIGDTRV